MVMGLFVMLPPTALLPPVAVTVLPPETSSHMVATTTKVTRAIAPMSQSGGGACLPATSARGSFAAASPLVRTVTGNTGRSGTASWLVSPGNSVSAKFVSSSEVQNAGDIPEYDYGLKDAYRDELERKRKEARERHRMLQMSGAVERQLWYSEYLQTPEWKDRWRLVMERAKGMCEGCGKSQARQVHHLTYEHAGDEFLWELRAVCHPCHARVHEKDVEA